MFMQRIRCVKLPSFLFQVVLVAFSRNDRAILRRISRAGGSGVNGRPGREIVSEGLTFAVYMYIYICICIYLVGRLDFLFFHILGIIIPTDELHHFSEGLG